MATGSAAAKKQRLVEAGYRTGVSSANGEPRCEHCWHVAKHPALTGATKNDRYCTRLDAPVKTHGCCKQFS